MAIATLVPGQKDWVNLINNNFKQVDRESESTSDFVLLNGWYKDSSQPSFKNSLTRYQLTNGQYLYLMRVAVCNDKLVPNHYGDAIELPSGWKSPAGHVISGNIPLQESGHFSGFLAVYGVGDGTDYRLSFGYIPVNGDAATKKMGFETTLAWII